MSVILSTDNLLEAARELLPAPEARQLTDAVIAAVAELASALAAQTGVIHRETSFQPDAGGLCASFRAGDAGQTSDVLARLDPGGEF